jgi:hypothetical protein
MVRQSDQRSRLNVQPSGLPTIRFFRMPNVPTFGTIKSRNNNHRSQIYGLSIASSSSSWYIYNYCCAPGWRRRLWRPKRGPFFSTTGRSSPALLGTKHQGCQHLHQRWRLRKPNWIRRRMKRPANRRSDIVDAAGSHRWILGRIGRHRQ